MIKLSSDIIKVIETLIRYIVYCGILFGTWLVVSPYVQSFKINRRYNFSKKEKSPITKHIELILSITSNAKTRYASKLRITFFYFTSFVLAALMFLLLFSLKVSIIYNICGCILGGVFPYGYLRLRLHSIRVLSSYEGEGVISEITNQYKINHNNMNEAISGAIKKLKKQPYTKNALVRLATELFNYQTREELQDIIFEFTFSIDTQWAIQMGNNMFLSIEYGDDVTESLEDILDDLKDLNRVNEKNNQINNESYMMIKYISPFSYLITVIILFKNFNFTLTKFIDYQFINTMGLKFFTLTIMSILGNFIVYSLVKKPKNDF